MCFSRNKLGGVGASAFGCFHLLLLQPLGASAFGCFCLWVFQLVGASACGCLSLWVFQPLCASACGCFNLWVLKPFGTAACGLGRDEDLFRLPQLPSTGLLLICMIKKHNSIFRALQSNQGVAAIQVKIDKS